MTARAELAIGPAQPWQSVDWRTVAPAEHIVHFYEEGARLVETVGDFIAAGLVQGAAGLVVATPAHRALLEEALAARGIDVPKLLRKEQLILRDSSEVLASFLVNGLPDAERFRDHVGALVERAAKRTAGRTVRVFGEMVDLLFDVGAREAAVRLERLWNELAPVHPFSLLCAYALRRFDREADGVPFRGICGEHSRVLPAITHRAVSGSDEQLRVLAGLEQRAMALEREVAERKKAESDLLQRERELQDRVRELADANRHKDRFLAMLSHELRNPLSAARTAVLAAQVDDDNRSRALAVAHDQIDLLARLIEDLLDVARIAHGRIRIEKRPTRLAGVVERALESTRPILEERQHQLSLELAAREVHVDGDAARLEQVVGNLLTNAAKYTELGGRIAITLEERNLEAVLRVRDSGIGIALDELDRIFDPFTQVDREADRRPGGLGIGLTVVREIVDLHGGRVEVHSAGAGTGTEVRVYLPALAGVVAAAPAGHPVDLSAPSIRILVVDDHAGAAEALTLLLRSFGHEVDFAEDGLAALKAAQSMKPNLMLVDIGLPGIDGYEVARRTRADPELRRAVLVALTGYGQPSDRQRAIAAGFDHHMTKPLDVAELEQLLKHFQSSRVGAR